MVPLLFVHGLAHGAWCWDEHFAPYFRERGYEAMAVDLRGHGKRRGTPLRWIPLSAYVDDVREASTKLHEPPVLIGHSMGGAIVQRYLSSGGQAKAAVLMASIPQRGAFGAANRYAMAHPLRFAAVNTTLSFKPMFRTPDGVATFFSPGFPQKELERFQPMLQEESYRAFVDMLLMAFSPPRPAGVPVLVVAASEDSFFPPPVQRRLAGYHSGEFELFDGLGHDLMLETGWETVAKRIEAFVEKVATAPATA